MNAQQLALSARGGRKRRGFSLMELMIVVVITSVLAAIAIPTFSGYIQRSRTSEATQLLGVIKLRQEAYRAEFGSYLVYGSGGGGTAINTLISRPLNDFIPDITSRPATQSDSPFPTDNTWFNQLGVRPDGGHVRFGYLWAAGTPDDAAANMAGAPYNLSPTDHYFVAQARGDLDNDDEICTFEVTSFTRGVWYTPIKGWE